jgi:hypothetical protein
VSVSVVGQARPQTPQLSASLSGLQTGGAPHGSGSKPALHFSPHVHVAVGSGGALSGVQVAYPFWMPGQFTEPLQVRGSEKSVSQPSGSSSVVCTEQLGAVAPVQFRHAPSHLYPQRPSAHERPPLACFAAGSASGQGRAQLPQLSGLSTTRVSHPSASGPSVLTPPPLQLRWSTSQANVQALFEHPRTAKGRVGQTVWHAPQCSAVCSETQLKLSGRPSAPEQQAGAWPEHGPGALPHLQVPTHRLLEVRGQVSSHASPQ